jgi:Sulfotransferase domain
MFGPKKEHCVLTYFKAGPMYNSIWKYIHDNDTMFDSERSGNNGGMSANISSTTTLDNNASIVNVASTDTVNSTATNSETNNNNATKKKNGPDLTPEQVRHRLHYYHTKAHHAHNQSNLITINGCILVPDLQLSWYYLPHIARQKKYIFLFRDPADLLYSYYTYITYNEFDVDVISSTRAVPGMQYRSPEAFHEAMMSGKKSPMGKVLLRSLVDLLQMARVLKDYMGDRVLFLRNEDMEPSVIHKPGGLLERLANFTGLPIEGFDADKTQQYTNCGAANKEVTNQAPVCAKKKAKGPAITGGRGMLPETRVLIYMQAYGHCRMWEREFGIRYE